MTIMYLDIDGVLWDIETFTLQKHAALGLPEFLEFALANFDVRWLTSWTLSGKMHEPGYEDLVAYTDIPRAVWEQINDGNPWWGNKIEGIDPDRPFVWVEDELLGREFRWMEERGLMHCFYHTDVFADPRALRRTLEKLKEDFG